MIEYRSIRVGLLGAGSVGSQVARLLLEHSDELTQRIGARLELVGIAVRDVDARRDAELPRDLFTTDAEALILGSDIVIELMGGLEPARTLVLAAIPGLYPLWMVTEQIVFSLVLIGVADYLDSDHMRSVFPRPKRA